jgi:hypothetical protein
MPNSTRRQICALTFVMLAGAWMTARPAFADAVQAGVTIPTGQPQPVITENGTGYTPGTYAIGTIHLNYTVIGTTFPTGTFAVFELKMADFLTSGRTPVYPVGLSLNQIGDGNPTLTPSASPLSVSGVGWQGSVLVTVSIPAAVANDPALNEDGDVLVAKLQLAADSPHLKTSTDILVKITLVHPTSCLKTYDFITDASLANTITSTEVNVNRQGKVTSTNPYGSLSHNVMVVNTCGNSESFDLRVNLDPWFLTQPANNPGNAVFTFATAGEIDPSTFNLAVFGTGTAQGQKTCLQNITVPAGSTFLATVHTNINNGQAASGLPSTGVFGGFTASLTEAGFACGGSLVPVATPNPTNAPLTFTIK